MFVKVCDIHQRTKVRSLKNIPFHLRIPTDFSPKESLSVGIKFMPKGFDDFKYPLFVTCDITNFILAIPIKARVAQVVAKAINLQRYMHFHTSKLLIVDKESEVTGEVIQCILGAINFQLEIIHPFKHGSARTGRQMQTTGKMITKHLGGKGEMLSFYAAIAAHAMNMFPLPVLPGFLPFEFFLRMRKPLDNKCSISTNRVICKKTP